MLKGFPHLSSAKIIFGITALIVVYFLVTFAGSYVRAQQADNQPPTAQRYDDLFPLLGLRCRRPAKDIQAALLERDVLVGTSSDPKVVRLLPPLTLEKQHVDTLINALSDIGQ